jgi:hypothetical protein
MKVNDLVRLKGNDDPSHKIQDCDIGIIIDCLEMDDGFYEYEILFSNGVIRWCSDMIIEVV